MGQRSRAFVTEFRDLHITSSVAVNRIWNFATSQSDSRLRIYHLRPLTSASSRERQIDGSDSASRDQQRKRHRKERQWIFNAFVGVKEGGPVNAYDCNQHRASQEEGADASEQSQENQNPSDQLRNGGRAHPEPRRFHKWVRCRERGELGKAGAFPTAQDFLRTMSYENRPHCQPQRNRYPGGEVAISLRNIWKPPLDYFGKCVSRSRRSLEYQMKCRPARNGH